MIICFRKSSTRPDGPTAASSSIIITRTIVPESTETPSDRLWELVSLPGSGLVPGFLGVGRGPEPSRFAGFRRPPTDPRRQGVSPQQPASQRSVGRSTGSARRGAVRCGNCWKHKDIRSRRRFCRRCRRRHRYFVRSFVRSFASPVSINDETHAGVELHPEYFSVSGLCLVSW